MVFNILFFVIRSTIVKKITQHSNGSTPTIMTKNLLCLQQHDETALPIDGKVCSNFLKNETFRFPKPMTLNKWTFPMCHAHPAETNCWTTKVQCRGAAPPRCQLNHPDIKAAGAEIAHRWPISHVTPLMGCLVSQFSLGLASLAPQKHLSWALACGFPCTDAHSTDNR